MAIKVIKSGRDTHSGHCTECGCRFRYERSDVHANWRRGCEEVTCPHCGAGCRHFGVSGTAWPRTTE